jgi:hypothetical protein
MPMRCRHLKRCVQLMGLLLLVGCAGGDRLAKVDPLTLPPDLEPGVVGDAAVTGERRTATLSDFAQAGGDGRIADPAADVSLDTDAEGRPHLRLPYPFLDAWRRVNLAVDRAGFSVEERDRSDRRFLVRYDPSSTQQFESRRRGAARLAFWRARSAEDMQPALYAVHLVAEGRDTLLWVSTEDGAAVDPTLARQLLDLIKTYLI